MNLVFKELLEEKYESDDEAFENIVNAREAGLKVGVYFFSQAVNEKEAVEEASMAIQLCKKHGIEMPITSAVNDIVEGRLLPQNAISTLMARELTNE